MGSHGNTLRIKMVEHGDRDASESLWRIVSAKQGRIRLFEKAVKRKRPTVRIIVNIPPPMHGIKPANGYQAQHRKHKASTN